MQVNVDGRQIPLGPGEFFGEMALLSRARRSADVTAIDYCQLLVLPERDFRMFVSKHPGLRAELGPAGGAAPDHEPGDGRGRGAGGVIGPDLR